MIARELAYGISHLPRSLEQRYRTHHQEAQDLLTAQGFLIGAKDLLPLGNPYFTDQENPAIQAYLASGFYNSCWTFETPKGKWVLKIAYEKSPMKTKFHPSSKEYSQAYSKSLDIQRGIFSDQLPHLIPEPQEVLYVPGTNRATTVVIQPFIDFVGPFHGIKKMNLSLNQREQLKGELRTFRELCERMWREHGLAPDLIRAGSHFVVAQKEDGPHLVMLDNDVFDRTHPTPMMNIINIVWGEMRIKEAIKQIKS